MKKNFECPQNLYMTALKDIRQGIFNKGGTQSNGVRLRISKQKLSLNKLLTCAFIHI